MNKLRIPSLPFIGELIPIVSIVLIGYSASMATDIYQRCKQIDDERYWAFLHPEEFNNPFSTGTKAFYDEIENDD